MDNLIKTISTLHSEIQSIVQECDLPRLNLELDALNHVYVERIEELKRERDELLTKLKNAQAKQIIAIAKERKRWAREDLKALAIRDLEQQAKGIEGILNGNEITHDEWISAEYLRDCIVDLKTQAKELCNE